MRRGKPGRDPLGLDLLLLRAFSCLALALGALGTRAALAAQERHDRDSRRTGPAALAFATGVRTMGLGGAFPFADGSDAAILHHPALVEGSGFGVAYHRLGDGGNLVATTASAPWFGGAAGLAATFVDSGERDRGASGEAKRRASSSFAVAAGFAGEALGIRIGGAAKLVGRDDGTSRSRTAAVDFGAGLEAGPATIALTVQNVGPALPGEGETAALATRVVLGAGVGRRPVGPLDIGGAVRLARDGDGEIVPGGGVEIAWWPIVRRVFIVRFGAVRVLEEHASPFTFGAGFAGDRIRLDYAYQDAGREGGRHAMGLAFR